MPLTPFTPDPGSIAASVANWIQIEPNMKKAFDTNGGWEGWAQVQLAIHLQGSTPTGVVSREMPIYEFSDDMRVDFFVKNPNGANVAMELKCRTKGENTTKFKKRFLNDILKVTTGLNDEAGKCVMWVMGITNATEDLDGWDALLGTTYIHGPGLVFNVGGWFVVVWISAHT